MLIEAALEEWPTLPSSGAGNLQGNSKVGGNQVLSAAPVPFVKAIPRYKSWSYLCRNEIAQETGRKLFYTDSKGEQIGTFSNGSRHTQLGISVLAHCSMDRPIVTESHQYHPDPLLRLRRNMEQLLCTFVENQAWLPSLKGYLPMVQFVEGLASASL